MYIIRNIKLKPHWANVNNFIVLMSQQKWKITN